MINQFRYLRWRKHKTKTLIQYSYGARISKRSSALFIRQFEIYFFRNLRAKKHSTSRCFAYHATIAETYRLYENKPVRNAHSSEERFEYKDCYNLNALDLLAPPFPSRQKVEKKTMIIVMFTCYYRVKSRSQVAGK